MQAVLFLIDTAFSLYLMVVILRLWLLSFSWTVHRLES